MHVKCIDNISLGMKYFLLIFFLALTYNASAQEKSKRIPYDWEAAQNFTDQTKKPIKAKVDNKIVYYDPESNQYLTAENFRKKYGIRTLTKFRNHRIEKINQDYRWRLNSVNAVVGGSMIGVSLATVLVGNMQDISVDALKTINYVGAGVALVGTIVLISGLHKEYVPGKGLAVSNHLYLDSPAGLSLAIAF